MCNSLDKFNQTAICKPQFKVAVLLPIMNEAEALERCLDSLVNQTLDSIAIIIQDNDSNDGSSEIISHYQKKFSNIFVNTNSKRVDSWMNWDLLWRYAEESFEFEFLFWMGGDDFLMENDFLRVLYNKGFGSNLEIVTPTINVIEGESGEFKTQVSIQLQSKVKFIRLMKYVNRWENVNLLHSLIRKTLYRKIIANADNSHTSYIANDWWFGAKIISGHQVKSLSSAHFCKSQWRARRYEWIEKPLVKTSTKTVQKRSGVFGKHIFQDFEILRKHIFHSHPIKHSLTKYEVLVIAMFQVAKTIYMPVIRLTRWTFYKLRTIRIKPIASSSTIN